MAASQVRVGPSQIEDLAVVCSIEASQLDRIATRLESGALLINRKLIDAVIYEVIGKDKGVHLSRFLFGVATALRQEPPSLTEILDAVSTTALREEKNEPRLAAWPACKDTLIRLLQTASIKLSAKALNVSYDFERVYTAGRFLTSLRPIFDEPRLKILVTAVVQTLRLEYFSSNGEQSSIGIAMDRTDILQLERSCKRALGKGDVAVHEARTTWGKPSIMVGEVESE